MKILLAFLFSISAYADETCLVDTYAQIIKINKNQDSMIIKNTDCSNETIQIFKNFINSASGKLQADYVSHYIKSEFKKSIKISPKQINISDIKELIQRRIKNNHIIVKNVTSMLAQSSINLNKNEEISISCKSCTTAGSKNISVEFRGKKHWLNANIQLKRTSYILDKDIISLSEKLDPSYFKKKTILDNGKSQLFEGIDNIKFYRLTRYLKKGDVIKRSDLSPRTLVRFGQKVRVKFKSKNIVLDSIAIANGNGRYGDFIQLTNPRSKKRVLAKIIDFNKAEIEL